MAIILKYDAAIIPFNDEFDIVVATDNSGSIGMKKWDDVSISYNTVAYYAFRVAYMECVSTGAIPFTVILQNYNGDMVWNQLVAGIEEGFKELGMQPLAITGSTESNFNLQQSAIGITILGKRKRDKCTVINNTYHYKYAVIGQPLVGQEVMNQKAAIAPLSLFAWLIEQHWTIGVLPVGSKGIEHAFTKAGLQMPKEFVPRLDVHKSSGPATCFIIIYHSEYHQVLAEKAGQLLYM